MNVGSTSDLTDKPTSLFDKTGRKQFEDKMREYGYVEVEGYVAQENAYCCLNCPYMVQVSESSPTGYWCKKYNFPDRPNGCCDGWEPRTR